GDKLDNTLVNDCAVKRASHNMPGIFNQLPGKRWFEVAGPYFTDRTQGAGTRIVDFEDMLNYLKSGKESSDICPMNRQFDIGPYDTLSPTLLETQYRQVYDVRDSWPKPEDVDAFVIAGHNISTLGDLVEYFKGSKHSVDALPTRNGDGTVPLISARIV